MDLELAKFLFQVLTFLVAGGTGFYVFMSNKNKVTNDRIEKLEEDIRADIGAQGVRIARLETRADGTPTHDDIGKLYTKINEVAGSMQHMAGEFTATNRILNLIHENLMGKSK